MKITIPTTTGAALKKKIFDHVKDETLKTWEITKGESGTEYLTHSPEQWADRAIMKFNVEKDVLEIIASKWKSNDVDKAANGYYIGRFTEILLVHFSDDFDTFTVSK
ncbi:hypothetical protein [Mucilaginibacter sp.]|uniref:hypothetical protein n=1 Tax=Mucilaginibacter sp. TaxID=1882438 RepID=UPI003265816B